MSDPLPDDLDPALVARVEELRDDPSTDFDAISRQAAGWFRIYVECPECEVPMARTTTESLGEKDGDVRTTRSELRGICPECGTIQTVITVDRVTGPLDALADSDA